MAATKALGGISAFAPSGSMIPRFSRRPSPSEPVGPSPPSARDDAGPGDAEVPGAEAAEQDAEVGSDPVELDIGRPLRFRFAAPGDALDALSIRFGTHRRTNVGRVICTVQRPPGTVLASAAIHLDTLEDGAFRDVLDLRGLPFAAGEECWAGLTLEAEPGHEVAVLDAPKAVAVPSVHHRLAWAEGAIRWSDETAPGDRVGFAPLPIGRGRPRRFRFVAPSEALDDLSVRFGTYLRTNVGRLACTLQHPFGTVLAAETVDLATLEDDAFRRVLDLRGLAFEPGLTYWVVLDLDAEAGNEVALFASDASTASRHRRLVGFEADRAVDAPSVERGLSAISAWVEGDRKARAATPPVLEAGAAPFAPRELRRREAFEFDVGYPGRKTRTLAVKIGTYGRRTDGHLVTELLDRTGRVLGRQALDLRDAVDNGITPVLDAGGLKLEPGRRLRARIQWFGDEGQEVALYAAPRPAPSPSIQHRIAWHQGAVLWSDELGRDAEPGVAEAPTRFDPLPIEVGRPVRFRFVAPGDALDALTIRFGTYLRTNRGLLTCALRRPSGTVAASGSVDLSTLVDNAFRDVLDLRGIAFVAGEACWVELALDAEAGNEVAVFAAEADADVSPRRRLAGFDPDREMDTGTVERGLVPRYRLDWDGHDAHWAIWPTVPGPDAPTFSPFILGRTVALEFDIVAPARRAKRLTVQVGTLGRRGPGYLVTELLDRSGRPLLRQGLDLSDAVDNAFAPVLDLTAQDLEPGRTYPVRIHWLGRQGGEVALYGAPIVDGRYELRPHLDHLSAERLFTAESWAEPARELGPAVLVVDSGELERVGALLERVRRALPGLSFTVLGFEEASRHLPALRRAGLVVFADMFHMTAAGGLAYDDLCFHLHRDRVCTLFLDTRGGLSPAVGTVLTPAARAAMAHRRQHARRCHYVASGVPDVTLEATWPGGPAASPVPPGGLDGDRLARLVADVWRPSRPRVAVVSVLHRKAGIIEAFLEHVRDQTYPGEITTVLVDDASPEDDAARARAFAARLARDGRHDRPVTVLANDRNLGNCASRLAGLAASAADIVIVVDCDCLINRDFVAAHVFEHWWDDVDAVTGPLNIESDRRDPAALVRALERDPAAVARESRPQDPLLPAGLVNCITRNFSIKRRAALAEPLFDLAFSYSAEPGSGFGWEDVEMGYRLYARGAVVRFTRHAFAVHCSHASSMADAQKVVGSTRNFARLFRKHPELGLVARRWATDTYDRIARWQDGLGVPSGPERIELDELFAEPRRRLDAALPMLRGEAPRLRVLTYRWHAPHQYELHKLGHDFTLATALGSSAADVWSYDQRPLRPNARLVPFGEIDPRDFDVVLLHFDENVMAAHLTNGVIPANWGDAFRRLLAVPHVPKIAVCHGTVPFVGQFGLDPGRKAAFEPHDGERRALVGALAAAGARVVCNSHQALAEWGFEDARVIWHGFDPQEFPRGTLERDVLALGADLARPHYRGAWEFTDAVSRLPPGTVVETAAHPGAPIENRSRNPYAVRNFRSYVDRIRQFKFYLNTTLRSPMPRSRGEAMMTGVIPVCLRNHDVDLFIDQGVDGFYADRPEDLARFIDDALRDPARVAAMSAAARLKALDVFNHDRYLAAWDALLREAV